MRKVSSFADRLKEYRATRNLTLIELMEITDVPFQSLSRYELGQRVPKIDAISKIASKLNINPLWLLGYDAPESISPGDNDVMLELIDLCRRLTPEAQKMVIAQLKGLLSNK